LTQRRGDRREARKEKDVHPDFLLLFPKYHHLNHLHRGCARLEEGTKMSRHDE